MLLNNNLLKKLERLQQELQEMKGEDRHNRLEMLDSDLKSVTDRLNSIGLQFSELEKSIEVLHKEQRKTAKELEEAKREERAQQERLDEEAKELEKMSNKQSMLMKKRDECTKKIRELGSLPSEAFEKYQSFGIKQLFHKLDECNNDLKKYSHVNKKALDQFVNFSDQKEKLIKRKEELDRADQSIKDLIYHLDQRKFEAIELTFKQVSKYFTEIFKKLVPAGHAVLVMKKADAGEEEDGDGSQEGTSRSHIVEQFTGVGIKVNYSLILISLYHFRFCQSVKDLSTLR